MITPAELVLAGAGHLDAAHITRRFEENLGSLICSLLSDSQLATLLAFDDIYDAADYLCLLVPDISEISETEKGLFLLEFAANSSN